MIKAKITLFTPFKHEKHTLKQDRLKWKNELNFEQPKPTSISWNSAALE